MMSLMSRKYLALSVLVFVAFCPVLMNGFVWDDFTYILRDPIIRATDAITQIWLGHVTTDFWPLSSSLFVFEWRLFEEDPLGYHIVNLIFHACNAAVLFTILRMLKLRYAYLCAVLFAVHPVAVDAVAWIYQTRTTLATLLGLLSFWWLLKYQQHPRRRILAFALAAFTFSLLAKTILVTLPIAFLIFEYSRSKFKGGIKKHWPLALFFIPSAVIGLIAVGWYPEIPFEFVASRSLWVKLGEASYLVFFYLSKILVPINLSFVYYNWRGEMPEWILLLSFFALFFSAIIGFFYRQHAVVKGIFFSLLCFIVLMFPVLGFFDIYFMSYSPAADHWQYPAYLLIIPVIVFLVDKFLSSSVSKLGLAGFATVVCLALSFQHTAIYKDEWTLWNHTLEMNPRSGLAMNNLGVLLEAQGRIEEAKVYWMKNLEQEPRDVQSHVNMGYYYIKKQQPDQALNHLAEALRQRPDSFSGNVNAGLAFILKKDYEKAIVHFKVALQVQPDASNVKNLLASAEAAIAKSKESK
jgi:protein O-mannosyl-transferase